METRNETIHEQGKLKRKLGLGAALAVAVGTRSTIPALSIFPPSFSPLKAMLPL